MSFVHLHNHSDRSPLDGLQSPEQMVARAAELGQPAVGLTDHGTLHGAYAFHAAAVKHGITPIIGLEAYLAPGDMTDKTKTFWGEPEQRRDDVSGAGAYTHLSLWATNEQGLRNLYALSSASYREGRYQKQRIDYDRLARHSAGLVASTGCPGGEVQTRMRLGQMKEAEAAAGKLRDILGPDRLFCELMDHGIAVEKRVREDLLALAGRMGLPLLATNDTHYSHAEDAATHDALLCVGVQKKLADADRFRFDGTDYYLKTADEMRGLFGHAEGACDNTLLIASMHEGYGELFERRDLMPRFPCPAGFDEASLLDRLAHEGLKRKGFGADRRYVDRLEYELGVIKGMGFPGYFLIVGEAVAWAKGSGIEVGPGRGSAAASLVCWVLDITAVDPLEHDLVFERFLNPERVSMPDIDLDFDEKDKVVAHLAEKYGEDRVARISTIMEVKSRNALKDAARVLGAPFMAGNMLAGALPPDLFGSPAPLAALTDEDEQRYDEMHKLRRLAAEPEYAPIVDLASRLEGTVRGMGMHAGGVVVSNRTLELDVPLAVQSGKVVTQYDMNEVEALGLLKIDALGLSTLGTLKRALAATGVDRHSVPEDDEATWALLASGHTTGVFQLESPGMQKALRQIKPTCLTDLAAVIALYRPGPMHSIDDYAARKHGQQRTVPIHPELEAELAPSLAETYHLLVFQEQVMQAARDVCGYSLGEADLLRRAMGKKDAEKMAQQRIMFFEQGQARGHTEEALDALWGKLVPFAAYGFNKPHAVAYASVGYLAAYLKAHFPVEYMAANLETVHGKTDKDEDKDKYLLSLAEVRRMGVRLLPPTIEQPFSGFRAEGGGIRYGLDVIKGVGTAVVADVAAGLPYEDLLDYMLRAGKGKNGGAIKGLAAAGALDSIGTRKGILEAAPQLAKRIAAVRKYTRKSNELTWENLAVEVAADEYDTAQVLALEKGVLGAYVSAHPLDDYRGEIAASKATPIGQVDEQPADTRMILIGTVATVAEKVTKNGNPFGAVKISDDTGDARFNVWSSSRGAIEWGEAKRILEPGAVVKVAVVRVEGERFSGLEIKNLRRLDTSRERANGSMLADYMLWWASKGVPVVAQEGRNPMLSGGILEATCDPNVIRHMAAHPRATGYGLRCGRSTGILGIDLDRKGGVDGLTEFDDLLGDVALPETMRTDTPSGGMHLLLRVPSSAWEWLRSVQRADLGIDLRCEGITGPGSRNEAGRYEPADDVRTIAEADEQVLAVLRELVESSPASTVVDYAADVDEQQMYAEAVAELGGVDEDEVAAAQRTIARLIGNQMTEIAKFNGLPEGSGLDGQLFRSAAALGHYVPLYLSWDRAHEVLLDAAIAAREDGDRQAFARTVTRGLKTGAAKPDRIRRLDRAPELVAAPEPPPDEPDPGPYEDEQQPAASEPAELPDIVCPQGVYNPAVVLDRILDKQGKKLGAATCLRDVTGPAWYLAKSLRPFGITRGEVLEYVLAKAPEPARDEVSIEAVKRAIVDGYANPQDYAASA